MMPRHTNKTYGRNGNGGQSNKAFDDAIRRASGRDKLFGDVTKNNKMSTAMASSSMKKFGNTSFTSNRSTGSSTPVLEIEPRKVKRPVEEPPEPSLFDDPFSFDSDDDGPTKPKKGMGFKKNKATALQLVQKNSGSSSRNSSDGESNGHGASAKITSRTYVRAKPMNKPALTSSVIADSINKIKKQSSMDSFMLKITTSNSKNSGNSGHVGQTFSANMTNLIEERPPKKRQKRTVVHKFFTSKNKCESASEDHNYSANLSNTQSQMRDDHCYSQTERSATDSPADKDVWSSDYDSDWDAESGDPEIVFNSPKKKALAAEVRSQGDFLTLKAPRNLQKDLGPSSPITIGSSIDDDASSLCSNISTKSNRTDLVSASDQEEESEPAFRSFPRTIRTYGKSGSKDSLPSSVSSTDERSSSLSLSQGNNATGLKDKKTAVPAMKKFSSLQENQVSRKLEPLSKPTVRRLLTSPKKKKVPTATLR